jgi:hypothetical protein
MRFKQAVAATALFCLAFVSSASAAEVKGKWGITKSDEPGKVELELSRRWKDGQSNHTSSIDPRELQGLVLTGAKHDVQFALVREAGRFDADGYLEEGEGAGLFRYTADPKFVPAMRALGFTGIDEEMQFAMAVIDVTTAFAKEMQALKLTGLTTDKVMALKIFNVDTAYVRALRAEGLPAVETDKIIAFRVHGVTVETVRAVRRAGLHPTEDQFIAMRVHDVTAEYLSTLKSRGVKNLTIDQAINLKIHGIE